MTFRGTLAMTYATYEDQFRAEVAEQITGLVDLHTRLIDAGVSDATGHLVDREPLEFPLPSREALPILEVLGYEATYKNLDYILRAGHMEAPSKTGASHRGYDWTLEAMVDFAWAMEKLKYWYAGRCIDRMSWYERDESAKTLGHTPAEWEHWQSMPIEDLVREVAREEGEARRQCKANALNARVPVLNWQFRVFFRSLIDPDRQAVRLTWAEELIEEGILELITE